MATRARSHNYCEIMIGARLLVGTGRTTTRMGAPIAFQEGLYEIARKTYAWMVPNGSWGETNLGLVDCGRETVLIDTCWDLHFTREMLRHAEPILSTSPIERVINTHGDGDHCWGNQLFADKLIMSTHACVDYMGHYSPGEMRAVRAGAKLLRHIPIAGLDSLGRYMARMLTPYHFSGIRLSPAHETFSGEKIVTVGGVTLQLLEFGPGHTRGDCIVWIPERETVFAGDILFAGLTPVAWAGPPENIRIGLRTLLEFDAKIIVPGHGPLAIRNDVHAQIDYWDWLESALEPMARSGVSPFEASQRCLRRDDFRTSVFARWSDQERIFTSACTLYRHWGLMAYTLPDPLGAMDHFRKQSLIMPTWH